MMDRNPSVAHTPGSKALLEPDLLADNREEDCWEQRLRVPGNLSCWPDHFPSQPVVPGVFQIYWVMRLLERWLAHPPRLASIEGLKFKKLMCPGQEFTMKLRLERRGVFRFRLADGATTFSQGRLVLFERMEGDS